METVWPLDRWDYLTVCDCHPVHYDSCAAMLARLGEDDPEQFNPPSYRTCAAGDRSDYRIIAASASLLHWVSLKELADEMECEKREVASLAHHLKSAVDAGLLVRVQRPTTVNGYKRLIWVYRHAG